MWTLLMLVSLLWVAAGSLLVLHTARTREVLASRLRGQGVRGVAWLPLVLGVVLLVGSFTMDRLFWWAFLVGAAAAAKGLYLLLAPPDRAARLVAWGLLQAEERTLRLWGVVALVLGTFLFSRLIG